MPVGPCDVFKRGNPISVKAIRRTKGQPISGSFKAPEGPLQQVGIGKEKKKEVEKNM